MRGVCGRSRLEEVLCDIEESHRTKKTHHQSRAAVGKRRITRREREEKREEREKREREQNGNEEQLRSYERESE
jgi:hypothetical protein